MPSWVPDWTNTNHYRLFGGRSTYHATIGFSAIFQFDVSGQVLSCRGLRIDTIDGLGESCLEDSQIRRPEDAVVQRRGNKNPYGSEDALKEALWNTLVGGRDLRGRKGPHYQCLLKCSPSAEGKCPTNISRGRTAFNRLITQSADLKISENTLRSYLPSVSLTDDKTLQDPLEKVFRFVRTRRLMVTLDGFIGLVPTDAQQGDVVCLLLGCNVPMVLRAVEDRQYKVVGGCYLHGVMEGEAMEWLREGRSHVEDVVLC